MDEVQFKEALNEKSTQVESLLKEYLPKEEGYQKKVIQAMNYSLMAGGTRLTGCLAERERKSIPLWRQWR